MIRAAIIERILRQVYGELPTDDSNVTKNLVNQWLNDAIGVAARKNYTDSLSLDGIAYVNNSFYSTFKGLAIDQDENFIYKITLPQIPVGLGKTEGMSTLQFKDSNGNISDPAIPISENQKGYFRSMRPIPNKILYYPEGTFAYVISDLPLYQYTASVSMVSGGDSTDLNSVLNVPDDYIPVLIEYCSKMLMLERQQPKDEVNDGEDN